MAARAASRLDVLPLIPDHDAVCEIELIVRCCTKDHPWGRFAASTMIIIVVHAYADLVQSELPLQLLVDCIDGCLAEGPPGNIWLIRNDNQHEAAIVERFTGFISSGKDHEFIEGSRSARHSVANW